MAQINSIADLVNLLRRNSETLTENDVENKFTRLSLAFKTDKLTLENRVGIQQRQRDDAERNVAREICELRGKLNRIQRLCQESETIEELSEVQRQVDVLAQSAESVSRAAEMYGAVQQEDRVSRAMDVILAHVENLRRSQSKERSELEEARRLLQEASTDERVGDELTTVVRGGSRLRQQQLQSVQASSSSRRRASIAALPRSASPAEQRFGSMVDATRVRQPVRALQDTSRRTSFSSSQQRADSTSVDGAESLRLKRDESGETEPANEATSGGVMSDVAVLHEDETPQLQLMDVSASEDELHDEDWPGSELRLRRKQSTLGAAAATNNALADKAQQAHSLRTVGRAAWRRVRSLQWPWSTEQSIMMLRRGATVVLLVLAAVTMLLVLVPVTASVVVGGRVVCWRPLRVELPAHFQGGYGLRPDLPPPV